MLKIGLSKTIINPPFGTCLAGYFNDRPARGVLDDLFLRVMLLEKEGVITGFLVYDLCFLPKEFVDDVKKMLAAAGIDFAENLSLSAIHTHTGPGLCVFLGLGYDPGYVEALKRKSVAAVQEALRCMKPGTLSWAQTDFNPYAFVRRYWMKSGKVVTNPGKLNPDIVKPESGFDHTVRLLAVHQEGRLSALMVNLANHTDTIGGELISADWPGRMEREIQYTLGEDVPVYTLIDCSGDINHFDVSTDRNQTSYQEALRIGRGYARLVLNLMEQLSPIAETELRIERTQVAIAYRDIPDADVAAAREVLARNPKKDSGEAMTSEGLASGDGAIARFFAENLIEYHDKCSGHSRPFDLLAVKLGEGLGFVTIPGEGFNGIARAIRAASPLSKVMVITLSLGEAGYISMPECAERGGYEVTPVVGGTPHQKTADQLIAAHTALLKKL